MAGIYVERVGDRIHLSGWVGPTTPTKCKAVGGGRFQKEPSPHWVYPLETITCYRLREVFGKALSIGPELNAWARVAIAAEKERLELARSTDATLHHVADYAPRIDEKAKDYQRVAAAFGARTECYLLADQQGLGKSVETLATLMERTADPFEVKYHLILAPSVAVRTVWTREINQWLGDIAQAHPIDGTHAEREAAFDAVPELVDVPAEVRHIFVICNIEMARIKPEPDPNDTRKQKFVVENATWPQLFSRVWDTIIVDESHRALVAKSRQRPTQQRAGIAKLRSISRIAISGTPMRGKPPQLWGTLNWLRPDIFSSYWKWVGRYWEIESDGFSNYVLGDFKPNGTQQLADDLAPFMLRRTKNEVLKELPPKTYAGTYITPGDDNSPFGVWLEPTPALAKQYARFIKDGSLDFAGGGEIIASGQLAEYTRKLQLSTAVHTLKNGKLVPTTDSPAFEWCLQKFDELGIIDGGPEAGKIVIVSRFTQLLEVFSEGFRAKGIATHLLTGKTSAKNRAAMVEDFQSENSAANVFLLNVQAGGVAITLDAADDLVFLDETTISDEQEQAEDRVHRASRIHNVTIHYLRVLDTIAEEIAWITAAQLSVNGYLLDGARGIDYARNLYKESRG